MTEHVQYGNVIDSGIPHPTHSGTEAFVETNGSVAITAKSIMAGQMRIDGEMIPCGILSLGGRVVGEDKTLGVVFVSSWMDMGQIAAALYSSAMNYSEDALMDFQAGLRNRQ